MKPQRLPGTCYNGTHWLNTEDCSSCNLKDKCIELNKSDAERKITVVNTTPIELKQKPLLGAQKKITNARAIENELLAGGDLATIIQNVVTVTGVSAGKIRNQIKGIRAKIHDQQGKWSKYTDVSSIDGQLHIILK